MPIIDPATRLREAFPAVQEWEDLGDGLHRGWETTAWRYVLFGGDPLRAASVGIDEYAAEREADQVEAYVRRKLAAEIGHQGGS